MIGPLISEKQRERVEGYIKKGIAEGARIVTGGGRPRDSMAAGSCGRRCSPTWQLDDHRPGRSSARCSRSSFDTEEDAIRIANDSVYGFGRQRVHTDFPKAVKIAKKIAPAHARSTCTRSIQCPLRRLQELRHRTRKRAGGHRTVLRGQSILLPFGYTPEAIG
jgi:hypothetical protein